METLARDKILATKPAPDFDIDAVRKDFPILESRVGKHPLAYFDNAATTQKPACVVSTLAEFYLSRNANIHRGIHYLSEQATSEYEKARECVAEFLGARESREIVFVRGTTEGINLVANSFGRVNLKEGDEILVSALEHHANIVPWQLLREVTGATIKVIPMNDRGELLLESYDQLLTERTRIVAVTYVSNALGTVNPIREIIDKAHERGIPVLVDGAQAVPHFPVDMTTLDCDFFVFSGHKAFGPTGIGVLYGKSERLAPLPPYQGGGEMISSVTFQESKFKDIPERFEAGTPHIAGAIGLATALNYLSSLGYDGIAAYENHLLKYTEQALASIPAVRIVGRARKKAGVVSFVMQGAHPHDIGTFLDADGIAIRAGHHCAQPVMNRLGIPGTARASLAFYNTIEEIDRMVESLHKVARFFN